jgi:hypothetical protein
MAGACEGRRIRRHYVGEKVAKGTFPMLSAVLAAECAQRFKKTRTTIGVGVTGLWLHVMLPPRSYITFTLNPTNLHLIARSVHAHFSIRTTDVSRYYTVFRKDLCQQRCCCTCHKLRGVSARAFATAIALTFRRAPGGECLRSHYWNYRRAGALRCARNPLGCRPLINETSRRQKNSSLQRRWRLFARRSQHLQRGIDHHG